MVGWRSLAARLARSKTVDGGYGSMPGAAPEPEATALAAIALDDADARAWLAGVQRADGSFGIDAGAVISDDTGLVSLALPAGPSLDRALDHVTSASGANAVDDRGAPPYGWAWTIGAHGWTEPTAWGVLALRRGRPSAVERIADGLDALRTQECNGGGWNYGTAESFGVAQPSFVQTTSIALFATLGADGELTRRGLAALARRWRREAAGPLSLAVASATMRLLGHPEATSAASRLEPTVTSTHDVDTVALAWATIALGPGLATFEVP
jgi:hypothetical protein